MTCAPCLPEQAIKCISGDEVISVYLAGLENGRAYYLRVRTQLGNVYLIPFTYNDGSPVEIAVDDLPEGFFVADKRLLVDVVYEESLAPVPFLFAQYVTGLNLEVQCNLYLPTEVGVEVTEV